MYIRHATLYVSSVHLLTEILYIYTHTYIIYIYIMYIIYIYCNINIYIYIYIYISHRQNRGPLKISNSKKTFQYSWAQ